MPAFPFALKRKDHPRVYKPRKSLKRKPAIAMVKNEIKKAFNKEIEVKTNSNINNVVLAGYNNTGIMASGIIPLTPYTGFMTVAQGIGQGDRIGNSIRIKRAMLHMAMWPHQYNALTVPFVIPVEIQIFILSNKVAPTVRPTTIQGLLQFGDTSADLTSSLQDCAITRPASFNLDLYHVHYYKRVKLAHAAWPTGASGWAANSNGFPNNDFKLNQVLQIDVTKFFPKVIQYNDTTANPTSRMTYLYVQAVNANGAQNTATSDAASMYQRIDIDYTDA